MMCAVAVAVVAFYFLHSSHTIDFNAEVGKWLLTVAAGLVLTGALSMVVKQIDQRRTERDAWHAVLKDLVAANQTVMLARLRLAAQQSALTYQEQLAEIMRARVELRGIEVIGLVTGDPALRGNVSAMHKYLDALGSEYETGYLCVARQQRLDELWLTGQMTAANVGTGGPTLPVPLAEPTKAWRLLQDREGFPRLAALLDHSAFPIDTFRTSYKRAKGCLEVRAGFRDRSMVDVIDSAGRFSDHARKFVARHADLPDEAGKCVLARVGDVKRACDKADRDAIEKATIELSKAAADAISAVYVVSKRSVTAAEDQAAAARTGAPMPPSNPVSPRRCSDA